MNESEHLPEAPLHGRLVDARLHLLDRLVVDVDGRPVTTVDDVDLAGVEAGADIDPAAPAPTVRAILSGNALPTRIFGGKPPDSRFDTIGWSDVARLGTTVELRVSGDDLDHLWVERWVRDRIVARIPGGRRAPE
ncbi:hypothetical protein G6038_27410 [Rhodococcus sp. 14C212]|uniref:hypothetical protein n=1 Tax=Rhodococcus sp. 14C212 TaxID=2711209 RepID=UPI0013EE0CEC|nr:hypothetical protein [Rhodococcus sp. 14C212]NGP09136.1 hypothetical protein [Rhodococcus sp. 14C212]